MRIRLRDFKLNHIYKAADKCEECGGEIFYKITWIDPETHDIGTIIWECSKCGINDIDNVGWTIANKPVEFMGKQFFPLTARANIGPCLNCGKLVIGVPLILFLNKGEKGELDFCFSCVKENGWDEKLFGARLIGE